MQTILITGGAGFIGSHLADSLLQDENLRLIILDNFNSFYDPQIKLANVASHLTHPRYELCRADLLDFAALSEMFARFRFDAIVHLAAAAGVRPSLEQPLAYEQINVAATVSLLELARQHQISKFIFGSSSSVYGSGAQAPFNEDALIRPISPYAATKAAGEMFVHTYSHLYGIRGICLRFFTVYGPRQRPDLAINKFAQLMLAGKTIELFGDGTTERDYTYVSDIVRGIEAALKYDGSNFEIINLGGAQTIQLKELVKLLEEALKLKAKIKWSRMHPGDLEQTHADIEKARRLLGWAPQISIDEGINKFIEWLKTQGKTQPHVSTKPS